MRAIYEAQIRSGYAQVVAKVKPGADAIVAIAHPLIQL
jgi:hypothetical protein